MDYHQLELSISCLILSVCFASLKSGVALSLSCARSKSNYRFIVSAPQEPLVWNQSTRLVFLTVHDDPDFAQDVGGLGYVVKARLASDLLPAIRAALDDRLFVSPTVHLDEARPTFPDLPENPTPIHGKP